MNTTDTTTNITSTTEYKTVRETIATNLTSRYNGRRGCCCGCRGTHYKVVTPAAVTRFDRLAAQVINGDVNGTVYCYGDAATGGLVAIDTTDNERVNILYFEAA